MQGKMLITNKIMNYQVFILPDRSLLNGLKYKEKKSL